MEPAENVLAGLLQRYPRLAPQREQILQAADLVVQCFEPSIYYKATWKFKIINDFPVFVLYK